MAEIPAFTLHKALALESINISLPDPIMLDEDVDFEAFKAHLDRFRAAPKFIITPDALTMLEAMGQDARQKVLMGMAEMGLFRLPFKEVVVQVNHKGKDQKSKQVFVLFKQLDEESMDVDASMIVQRDNREEFGILPLWWRIEPQISGGFMHLYTHCQSEWFLNDAKAHKASEWVKQNKERNRVAAEGLATLILLLATRGIAKERVDAPERLNKKRLQARKEPLYSHTVLRLHPKLKHLEGKTYRDGEGRAMPRLHWRIGHKRDQRCGPKLCETKTIWIDGQIVGSDANGIVTHDYEF